MWRARRRAMRSRERSRELLNALRSARNRKMKMPVFKHDYRGLKKLDR